MRFELLAMLIKHILELPYASAPLVYKLMYVLMKDYNFYALFSDGNEIESTRPKEDTSKEKDLDIKQDVNNSALEFWRVLISQHPLVFNQLVDLLLCHEGADITAVLTFIQEQIKLDDTERWISFISVRSNIEKLDAVFERTGSRKPISFVGKGQETYFDFLVVQNELIKAQEAIKMELGGKINELKRERDELSLQKDNLEDACASLEVELRECQEGYVNEVKKMFYDAKKQCEKYEKENIELRSKIYGARGKDR